MFRKVLIANRGTIACRVIRTLDRLGVASVAVYSEADRHSLHVRQAGEAVCIGPPPASESYLRADKVLAAAKATGADAIHPGYGFLSENPDFAEACAADDIVFVGPRPEHMRAFGLKHTAREIAERAGVPLAPGTGLLADVEAAREAAERIGFPLMLKSTGGGGGIGLVMCRSAAELAPAFERVARLARNNFKNAGLYLEKFVAHGRHIEVQIFGDGRGRVAALGERDCSAQRRNQKVVEETPAPNFSSGMREQLLASAVRLGEIVSYENAGTVEYLYDVDGERFYFLEVNTRLQVEHGVTEEVTGIDLVELMLRQAAGETWPLDRVPAPSGHSIQVRLYAENPAKDFRPSAGLLTHAVFPRAAARVETWVEAGIEVPPFYDPMIGKLLVHGPDRESARRKLAEALRQTELAGIETNRDYLLALLDAPFFVAGETTTTTLAAFGYAPEAIEVVAPGTQTTVQDCPGRLGLWDVGVPPSGPMDGRSFRLANRAVGNPSGAAGLEITLAGPTLRFAGGVTVCLAGAVMAATLDGEPVPFHEPVAIAAGQTLAIGALTGPGVRAYLAVRGGIDVPEYLGSRATFTLGRFGGHAGRALLAGDTLHVGDAAIAAPAPIPPSVRPEIVGAWTIGALYGPHGAPDFFTEDDIDHFFAAAFEVHFNSNRTGVRLIGPKPRWARADGGEAGLHPSNIHDNAYAIGAVDFTGDLPVILGPDGPSLGGFVCPAVVALAELWKIGQLRPGDIVRFRRVSAGEADALRRAQDAAIADPPRPALRTALSPARAVPSTRSSGESDLPDSPVLGEIAATGETPRVVYRRAGDGNILVEYGPPVLDIELRLRAQVLLELLRTQNLDWAIDLTPGIRSLQVHFDPGRISTRQVMSCLEQTEKKIPALGAMRVPSRTVRMPLSWDDPATQLAIQRYLQGVRPDAPWGPSNIEFIRRINGLDGVEQVKRIVFDAAYLVLGLGDVYLGAPVATPLDPRHRLVTTKYNPARTWTPENAVGIGGAYMCIYGMEGPGGYQFVGRTAQVWNTYRATAEFEPGKPWLLRFFDQVRFFEVGHAELLEFRAAFLHGEVGLEISQGSFAIGAYRDFLAENADSIAAFRRTQRAAFEGERQRWIASGQNVFDSAHAEAGDTEDADPLPPGTVAVTSPVPGSVWRIEKRAGDAIAAGETLLVIESMKTEIAVFSSVGGLVREVRCTEGRSVSLGQVLAAIEPR